MLKTEINELLTQTGPGTPAGDLFRQYWIPALLAEELPENDGAAGAREDPLRAPDRVPQQRGRVRADRRVLRAPRRVALVRQRPGVRHPLRLPRLEVRHERPVPRGPVRAREQQLREQGEADLVPAREGRRHPLDVPGRPRRAGRRCRSSSSSASPPEQTYTSKRWQESNWLQALEGGIDSSHVSWLHSGGLKNDPLFKGAKGNEYNLNDLRPFFEVAEADGGLFVGARRNAEDGRYYWRITPWVMPALHDRAAARATTPSTATSGCRSTTRTASSTPSTTTRRAR